MITYSKKKKDINWNILIKSRADKFPHQLSQEKKNI